MIDCLMAISLLYINITQAKGYVKYNIAFYKGGLNFLEDTSFPFLSYY